MTHPVKNYLRNMTSLDKSFQANDSASKEGRKVLKVKAQRHFGAKICRELSVTLNQGLFNARFSPPFAKTQHLYLTHICCILYFLMILEKLLLSYIRDNRLNSFQDLV